MRRAQAPDALTASNSHSMSMKRRELSHVLVTELFVLDRYSVQRRSYDAFVVRQSTTKAPIGFALCTPPVQ